MALTVSTINICGLNDINKQIQVKMLVMKYKIDILCLQEHNVKDRNRMSYLEDFFDIVVNEPVPFKGGTAFLINKRSNVEIVSVEKDEEGQITLIRVKFMGKYLSLLNIYAPSGNNKKKDREDFFQNDLLYFLRHNISNLIMVGDFNCVLSSRDVSTGKETNVSKALTTVVRNLKLKDAWFATNHLPVYTYIKGDYGSRLDRIYVNNLFNDIVNCQNIPLAMSDHAMIMMKILIDVNCKIGKGHWLLNCSLLDRDDFLENFNIFWGNVKLKMCKYDNILLWWDELAKGEIKKFFIRLSKQAVQEKYGTIALLQEHLKILQYEAVEGSIKYNEIKLVKSRIKSIKEEICEGIKMKMKMEERVNGEKLSLHLLSKEKIRAKRNHMTELHTEGGVILKNSDSIIFYAKQYYTDLFTKANTDTDWQEYFLKYVETVINDEDNEILCTKVTEKEILKIFQSMARGKTPGEDGLPVEFYLKTWNIIKHEYVQMVEYVFDHCILGNSQLKGIIKLLSNNDDVCFLKN